MSNHPSRRLSVCIIVKNEADRLRRCLLSIAPAADELIVVDTGSTDNTVEVARECGAVVVQSDWRNDFSYSRNISLRNATGDWILWLDADDVVPPESIEGLNTLKAGNPDRVFGLVVRNEKGGDIGSEFIQARMFPNGRGICFERKIHEQMMPSALRAGLTMETRPVVIEHHGYADPREMKKKARRNIDMLLEQYDEGSTDAVTAIEIADAYSIIDERENASKWYRTVLKVPGCTGSQPVIASQAFLGLGNMYSKDERFDEAMEQFRRSLELCPGRPDALYSLAVAQELSGRKDDAAATLARILDSTGKRTVQVSIDFRQTRIKAFLRLGAVLGGLKRFGELDDLVKRALEEYPERPEIHNMAAVAHFQRGKLMDALHGFERSLDLAVAGNIDAYVGLCVIYRAAGKNDAVAQTLEHIKALFESSPRYWALREILQAGGSPADSVDRDKVRKEKEYLRGIYLL